MNISKAPTYSIIAFSCLWTILCVSLAPFFGILMAAIFLAGCFVGSGLILYWSLRPDKQIESDELSIPDLIESEMENDGKFDEAFVFIEQMHNEAVSDWLTRLTQGPIKRKPFETWVRDQLLEMGYKNQFYGKWPLPEDDFEQVLLDALSSHSDSELSSLAAGLTEEGTDKETDHIKRLERQVLRHHKKVDSHSHSGASPVRLMRNRKTIRDFNEEDVGEDGRVVFSMKNNENVGAVGTVSKKDRIGEDFETKHREAVARIKRKKKAGESLSKLEKAMLRAHESGQRLIDSLEQMKAKERK